MKYKQLYFARIYKIPQNIFNNKNVIRLPSQFTPLVEAVKIQKQQLVLLTAMFCANVELIRRAALPRFYTGNKKMPISYSHTCASYSSRKSQMIAEIEFSTSAIYQSTKIISYISSRPFATRTKFSLRFSFILHGETGRTIINPHVVGFFHDRHFRALSNCHFFC